MEQTKSAQTHSTYPDPTKPVIPPIHKKLSVGWILFIGFNILLPIAFVVAYLFLNK